LPVYANLIKDLNVTGINQLWVADITYIHILVCFIWSEPLGLHRN
jgi:hypothetical protein